MKIKDSSFDYDANGKNYSSHRRTDPRIEKVIHEALGTAKTVLNVGAGSGSYEPEFNDRYVIAVEPSVSMRKQRLQNNRVPAVVGKSDALPFDDESFDATMAILTIHHWKNLMKGLTELRRVTRNQVIIMTYDPDELDSFWTNEYFPELIDIEKSRFPKIDMVIDRLEGNSTIKEISIPLDCRDGFQEAFYGRPEAFLSREIRASQSAWGFLSEAKEQILVKRLSDDLQSGEWDKKYGYYRKEPYLNGALRMIVSMKE